MGREFCGGGSHSSGDEVPGISSSQDAGSEVPGVSGGGGASVTSRAVEAAAQALPCTSDIKWVGMVGSIGGEDGGEGEVGECPGVKSSQGSGVGEGTCGGKGTTNLRYGTISPRTWTCRLSFSLGSSMLRYVYTVLYYTLHYRCCICCLFKYYALYVILLNNTVAMKTQV